MTLAQTVYADNEVAATITSVVLFDARAGAPKAFPEPVRKRLETGRPLG